MLTKNATNRFRSRFHATESDRYVNEGVTDSSGGMDSSEVPSLRLPSFSVSVKVSWTTNQVSSMSGEPGSIRTGSWLIGSLQDVDGHGLETATIVSSAVVLDRCNATP